MPRVSGSKAPPESIHSDEEATIDLTSDRASVSKLNHIWDAYHIEDTIIDGVAGWMCKWCGKPFKRKHGTRVLWHLLKIKGQGIAVCLAIIPQDYITLYQELYNRNVGRAHARVQFKADNEAFVVDRQQDAVASMTAKCAAKASGCAHSSSRRTSNSLGFELSASKKRRVRLGFQPDKVAQSSIETAVNRLVQTDINAVNNTSLEMAIADFFHCEAVPDRAADSTRFRLVIKLAMLASPDFAVPGRKKVGGPLLDLNYKSIQRANKKTLLSDAATFGLVLMGDGATIHRMPLINCLAMCGDCPPVVLSINDCTEHLQQGGKKDAPYIASLFETHLLVLDEQKTLVDLFYFDGASNVQKAGRLLSVKYPRAVCLHGSEHVVSLFFSDLAKMRPFKVSLI